VLVALLVVSGCAPVAEPIGSATRIPAPEQSPTEPAPAPSVSPTPSGGPSATATPTPVPTPPPPPPFDRAARSIDDPASLWVVANKLRPLNPREFAPGDLRAAAIPFVFEPLLRDEAATAAERLVAAATAEGIALTAQSSYRSYASQQRVYAGWVARLGQEAADLTSARPGHSEHQTGLAIDFSAVPANCTLDQCFASTPQGQWLAANAWRFGFHLRYPEGATPITGYEFEPWHYRYVGPELATELHETGIRTLEEFFGLPAAPDYAG
jgi:zinc D-Ala-D-Ala carboxypeptidase